LSSPPIGFVALELFLELQNIYVELPNNIFAIHVLDVPTFPKTCIIDDVIVRHSYTWSPPFGFVLALDLKKI
jgi:hypothetical protein